MGYIYAARSETHPKYIKVGRTVDWVRRLTNLPGQTGIAGPFRAVHLWGCRDSVMVERAIHDALADYRVDGYGREVFEISARKLRAIADEAISTAGLHAEYFQAGDAFELPEFKLKPGRNKVVTLQAYIVHVGGTRKAAQELGVHDSLISRRRHNGRDYYVEMENGVAVAWWERVPAGRTLPRNMNA